MQPQDLDTSVPCRIDTIWLCRESLLIMGGLWSQAATIAGMSKSSLTSKQRHFCRLVAEGTMSNAQAYRQAYDVSPDANPKTQREAASRLLSRADVTAMVEGIIAKRERVYRDRGLSKRDLIISKLSEAIDDNDFGVNRLKAISLMADCLGMRRHSLDVTQNDNRSAEAITADLEAKLSALGLTDQDQNGNIGTVIDHDSITYHSEVVDDGDVIEPDEIIETDSTRH